MPDVVFVALVFVFFGVCAAFVRGCDHLVTAAHDDEPSAESRR